MIFRNLEERDVDRIVELEKECFSDPWSKASILAELMGKQCHYIVVEIDEQIVGYGGFWKIFDEGHITNFAVSAQYRGRRIGEQLMIQLLAYGRELKIHRFTLEVRVSNHVAIRLYEKLGFVSAGERPGFYENPKEAAYIMWLEA